MTAAQQAAGRSAEEVVARARELLPGLEPAEGADARELLTGVVADVVVALADGPPAGRLDRLVRLAVDAQDLLRDFDERRSAHRRRLLAQVHEGLARLNRITGSDELLDRVCTEAATACGLPRVLLSRVEDGAWIPWMFHGDDEDEARRIAGALKVPVPLDDAPIERAIVARGRPAIVADAATRRAYGPLIGIVGSTSYVVAPITPAGRVVGLLHGDPGPGAPRVDLVDREVLWTFAEGVGRIYGRLELHQRLRAQRGRVREALEVVERTMSVIDEEEIHLVGAAEADGPSEDHDRSDAPADPVVGALLTDREREVMALMARGHNNAAIAERLVIREGTVKSHVKHILRKLGAANRAEAIARFLGHG